MTNRSALVLVLLSIPGIGFYNPAAIAADSAVIFVYHHVDSETPAITSVTPERFAEHLEFLEKENFHVRPLLEILRAIEAGQPVKDKTVALTFDDGYNSVLETAMPMLASRNWPFTVFVSTDNSDRGYGSYLGWDELRELSENGATIGNHTRTHAHLIRRNDGEAHEDYSARVRAEIVAAGERISSELGDAAIPVFAYPYGEYNAKLKEIVRDLGLLGLGQHSGAVGPQSDLLAAPRYPVTTGYDELDDFALRARSRPLPASVPGPERHLLENSEPPPVLRLEISPGDFRIGELACYAPNQGAMELVWADNDMTDVTIRPSQAFGAGRTKYNCTAPSASESGVYYWYSHLWIKRNSDGSWYVE